MNWIFNLGSVASFLNNFFSNILAFLQTVIVTIWNTLVAIYQFLLTGLINIVLFLARSLGKVGTFFKNFRLNWIPKGILKLLDLYDKLMRKLERILKPYLDFIRKVRDLWDKIFFRIFGPILNLIQQVRGVLGIFRIFGLKFAQKLDERLLRLEGKILAPYLEVRAKINEVITAINLVLDVGGLIRRGVTLGSLATIWGGLVGLLDRRMNRKLTPDEEANQKFDRTRYNVDTALQNSATRTQSGFFPEDLRIFAGLNRELVSVTGIQRAPVIQGN